jgi:multiple RNA-binding domain-containing protein 1
MHIPINRESKQPKGIAFVQYMNPTDAVRALNETDGKIFQGKKVRKK